jgi:hypothetical protein
MASLSTHAANAPTPVDAVESAAADGHTPVDVVEAPAAAVPTRTPVDVVAAAAVLDMDTAAAVNAPNVETGAGINQGQSCGEKAKDQDLGHDGELSEVIPTSESEP